MAQVPTQNLKSIEPSSAYIKLAELCKREETQILQDWIHAQSNSLSNRKDLMSDKSLHAQSKQFLSLFVEALQNSADQNLDNSNWDPAKKFLEEISVSRAQQGFSPVETATFIFSFKKPLFDLVHADSAKDPRALAEMLWALTLTVDGLGLYTTEIYLKTREEVIRRQQQDMLELSTPVVSLWDGILALPLIGTLDSARTQVVMETLLQEIVDTSASIAIIDITGVPTVDTLVAQHLLKTVAAARLMGADCIISGIRPQIAQTIVHLGVELNDVITKATLADAFSIALTRLKLTVAKVADVTK